MRLMGDCECVSSVIEPAERRADERRVGWVMRGFEVKGERERGLMTREEGRERVIKAERCP